MKNFIGGFTFMRFQKEIYVLTFKILFIPKLIENYQQVDNNLGLMQYFLFLVVHTVKKSLIFNLGKTYFDRLFKNY